MLQAMIEMSKMMTGVQARITQEHEDFLVFYEALIRQVSPAASKSFGSLEVETKSGEKCRIELTPPDLGYWRQAIASGVRFKHGVGHVKKEMYNRMCNAAEAHDMDADQRAKFIDLIRQT